MVVIGDYFTGPADLLEAQHRSTNLTNDEYGYSQIPSPHLVRVLHLKVGAKEDPLEGSLECVDLGQRPKHYAISYTWGDETRCCAIRIDGKTFAITASLDGALRRVRFHMQSKCEILPVWTDAICINQANNEEKDQQLPLMGQIYGGCQTCWIYLGETENNSLLVGVALSFFGTPIKRFRETQPSGRAK
jgi:Heterokaryon incompatibility protein (HET)